MVQTAPMPGSFGAAIDAGTLPPAPATPASDSSPPQPAPAPARHPLEAWADPAPRVEPTIRRDLHPSGYLNATRTALANLAAAEERERALGRTADGSPVIEHASVLAARRRQREDEAEAARRAGPDPREVLRTALGLRDEAALAVIRLEAPLARARQLVEDLEGRQREAAAAAAAGDESAREALIQALAAGTETPPAPAEVAPVEGLPHELRIARLALDRLVDEDRAARDLLERRTHGVARCAHQVLIAEAGELARQIIAEADQLARQRADLDALAMLLTAENRRLNRPPVALPAAISRALYDSAAPAQAETDWRAVYDQLQAEGADPI